MKKMKIEAMGQIYDKMRLNMTKYTALCLTVLLDIFYYARTTYFLRSYGLIRFDLLLKLVATFGCCGPIMSVLASSEVEPLPIALSSSTGYYAIRINHAQLSYPAFSSIYNLKSRKLSVMLLLANNNNLSGC